MLILIRATAGIFTIPPAQKVLAHSHLLIGLMFSRVLSPLLLTYRILIQL